jgi:hypothetical protein
MHVACQLTEKGREKGEQSMERGMQEARGKFIYKG